MDDVVCGGAVAGGTIGVWVRLGGGVTAQAGGSTEEVAVGVGRYNWVICWAGVTGSPPGTVCGVCGWILG